MNLFIVGNGFDIAHGLPTLYTDFRHYLEDNDWAYLTRLEEMYGFVAESQRKFVEDSLWKEFESQLAVINEEELIYSGTSINMGLEGGDIVVEDMLDSYWEDQYKYIKGLNEYIRLWVEQIDINVPKKTNKITSISDDMFMTFNYTLLLEKKYHIDEWNILHIHGSIDEKDNPPIIGHGNSFKIREARKHAKQAEAEFLEKDTSIYNALANYYERTLKDVNHYIVSNSCFFERLCNVDQIFIIGHSLGDVDIAYFRAIKENLKQVVIWNIYYNKSSDKTEFWDKIISIGVEEKSIQILPSARFFQ